MKALLPWLVAVAFFMESLDTTILNPAVPSIAAALHVAPLSMKVALTSYTLSLAVFIPVSGWMADRYGTRRVFATAIGIFSLGSFLCGVASSIHMLVAARILQGCGGSMMVPVGRLTLVRTFERHELVRVLSFVSIPALIGPLVGPLAGGLIVGYLHWSLIFFVNVPIGAIGLYLVLRYLPDYRADKVDPLDVTGMALFGAGVALLSYVLEVFGEHTLSVLEMMGLLALAAALLLVYRHHASQASHPVLRLGLFRTRTFRVQVGLGYTAVQSGLLIMPQFLAAISLKFTIPAVLTRLGYRRVLGINTLFMGLVIGLFAAIGNATPIWVIALQAVAFGYVSSLQYTSMNTLVYADLDERDTSMGSSIASTIQQMSMSFGVAVASLATAVFVPDRFRATPLEMMSGIHKAFVVLGLLTVLSALIFRELRAEDGANVSRHLPVTNDSLAVAGASSHEGVSSPKKA